MKELTVAQLLAVEAVIRYGDNKQAGRHLGLSSRTVDAHMAEAKVRLGITAEGYAGRTFLVLAVDRWVQRGRPA